MEKVISVVKILYFLLLFIGLGLLGMQIYADTVSPYYFPPSFLNLVSALVILLLMFVAYTSVFMVAIGILRKSAAKDNIEKANAAKKLIKKGVLMFIAAFIIWVVINLYSVFAFSMDTL